MKFTLVDKVISIEPGKSIRTIKNLSRAEEYLNDHFPRFPIMPGVLMLEAMVQTGSWLMRATTDFAHSTIILRNTRALRFKKLVAPGQQLAVECTVQKWDGNLCEMKGEGSLQGESCVSGRFVLEQLNLADRNENLAKNDQFCIARLREEFEALMGQGTAIAR